MSTLSARHLNVANIDFNDQKTWDLLCAGNTAGVFQLESSGMTEACVEIQPRCMNDIIALLSLYRPDTMGELKHYINRKHGREEVTYVHPEMEKILSKTYGCLIYQEQVMKITQVFAGFSDGEADDFRKGIGKKNQAIVRAQAEKFRVRALEKGYAEEVVNEIADELAKKGGYMFNAGHASGYGITTFKTAYLKANYPVEYMCSLLSNQKKDTGATDYDSVAMYLVKAKEMGIPVLSPDINKSQPEFVPCDGGAMYGFDLIKGVGKVAVDYIMENRPFESFEAFLKRSLTSKAINKTVIVSLVKSGCFDFTGKTRKELLKKYGEFRYKNKLDSNLYPLESVNKNHIAFLLEKQIIKESEKEDKELCLVAINKYRRAQFLHEWEKDVMEGDEFTWEFQTISNHLKGDPFDGHKLPDWESYEEGFEHSKFFGTVVSIKKTKIKRGNQKGKTMAFVEFMTPEGLREGVCFADVWERLQERLEKGNLVVIKGKKQGEKCIVGGAKSFEEWKKDGS